LKLNFKFEGISALTNNLDKLTNAVSGPMTEETALKVATSISEDARSRAPLGPTGNLKRSLVAKLLDKRGDNPRVAVAAVDRKIAPHAHLLEFGTSRMSARPFFRPAVEKYSNQFTKNIKTQIEGWRHGLRYTKKGAIERPNL